MGVVAGVMGTLQAAVVVATAETSGCRLILSRNVADFKGAAVDVLSPEEFLAQRD
jgi:hypothetical protein